MAVHRKSLGIYKTFPRTSKSSQRSQDKHTKIRDLFPNSRRGLSGASCPISGGRSVSLDSRRLQSYFLSRWIQHFLTSLRMGASLTVGGSRGLGKGFLLLLLWSCSRLSPHLKAALMALLPLSWPPAAAISVCCAVASASFLKISVFLPNES